VSSRITLRTIPSTPRNRLDQFHWIELDFRQSSMWPRTVCCRWIYRLRSSVGRPALRAVPIESTRLNRVARLRLDRSLLTAIRYGYRLSLGPHVRWSVCHLTSIDESGGQLPRVRSSDPARPFPESLVFYDTGLKILLHLACWSSLHQDQKASNLYNS